MPKRKITNAITRTTTAWAKRERKSFMPSLERQQERDQVRVLLRRQGLAEHGRHHALREARDRSRAGRIQDLLHDVVGRLDLRNLREIGTNGRGADLARLVAGDAGALGAEDDFSRLRVARNLDLSRRATGGRARGLRDVVERDVDVAALGLEERGEGPDLGAVERDRRLVDLRHDVRVALDEVRTRLQQRFDDVLLRAHSRLRLAGAGADAGQVGRAGPLLADAVTDLARALGMEDLLAGLHELGRRHVAALERELGGGLGMELGDRVRVVRVGAHHDQRERTDLTATGRRIGYGRRSLPPAMTGAAWP